MGIKKNGDIVDDLYDNTDSYNEKRYYDQFMPSKYAYFIYLFRKLLI